jgi:O-6-methylguanine DNA methyltransferase
MNDAPTISMSSAKLPKLGTTVIAVSDRGVCGLALPDWNDHDMHLEHWRAAVVRRGHPLIDRAVDELRRYVAGTLRGFTVPVDLGPLPGFTGKVLTALLAVPYGTLVTYRDLAIRAGSPKAARAVGQAVGRNPLPVIVACHRVVACGGIGGFGLGLEAKRKLLAIEGVDLDDPALA